ncbi:hypothetical protein NA57DRAFT_58689 [Rhizodiscina lignyota]|uniref:Uncharacterized protein n=1 Tax=Rhizodiscina lignyota TaxID=1504668 RepID=A0A9P4IBS2_9PEZI|nr:hypothetical protein NA57DRAFT_58689 [Rhizodiscina lignyota]
MPPIRTVSTTKPMKTERTHEENQERAYIAASRRSDRSLEARIESARRASEIHKKRTGRALRVTEQDVVNEEMYEEEDDDLPAQIRRLQSFAHLQTGSMEFNRRLQAYMSSQLGTRSALMEQGNFFQPYPNAPFFANQFGQPQQQQPMMLPPQMLHYSNQQVRHAPYPMSPRNLGTGMHQRSASISTTHDSNSIHSNPTSPAMPRYNEEQRRVSLSPRSTSVTPVSQAQTPMRPPMSRSTSNVKVDGSTPPRNMFSEAPNPSNPSATSASSLSANVEPFLDPFPQNVNFAPFSTSLPQETQQLLAQPSMDAQSSLNSYWMPSNHAPFLYSYKPNSASQPQSPAPGLHNPMNTALSLNPLDTSADEHFSKSYATSAATDGITTPFSGTFDNFNNFNFGADNMFADGSKDSTMTRTSSAQDSAVITPGGGDWMNFLESFEDVTSGHVSN